MAEKTAKKWLKISGTIFFLLFFWKANAAAHASDGDNLRHVLHGAGQTLFSSMEIPRTILRNSAPFPFNIVTGAVAGTFRTVAGTVMGAAEMARGAAPYAKYAIFAL